MDAEWKDREAALRDEYRLAIVMSWYKSPFSSGLEYQEEIADETFFRRKTQDNEVESMRKRFSVDFNRRRDEIEKDTADKFE